MALIVSMLAMTLMMALGAGLVLTTSAETMIAANFRNAREVDSAATAAVERALADLRRVPDWNDALSGAIRSTFVDGAPGGARTLPDGSALNLTEVVNMANCGTLTDCTDGQMNAATLDRPWGVNNPRWKLYAYGPLRDLLSDSIRSWCYVVVLVADDQSDDDANPSLDGSGANNPGRGIVVLRADAFGPRRSHRGVEATVMRVPAPGGTTRVLSWRRLSRLDRS
jgi:hypothetical protein